MLKKVFSLLLAAVIFMPASFAVAADIKVFSGTAGNQISAPANVIQNDVHFVKDYSRMFADVYKYFVNNISVLAALQDFQDPLTSLQNALKTFQITEGIFINNFLEKKSSLCGSFIDHQTSRGSETAIVVFFIFVLMFILWYIGLLRLFNGVSFFNMRIRV